MSSGARLPRESSPAQPRRPPSPRAPASAQPYCSPRMRSAPCPAGSGYAEWSSGGLRPVFVGKSCRLPPLDWGGAGSGVAASAPRPRPRARRPRTRRPPGPARPAAARAARPARRRFGYVEWSSGACAPFSSGNRVVHPHSTWCGARPRPASGMSSGRVGACAPFSAGNRVVCPHSTWCGAPGGPRWREPRPPARQVVRERRFR